MARIKLGALISDIRGKLQNGVYSLAKGGVHYVKNIPASVTNPNSLDQQAVRTMMQDAGKRWYNTLTAAQRAGWEELAQQLSGLAFEGNGGILNLVPAIGMKGSGINAFVGFYVRSWAAGLYGSWTDDAPLGEVQPTPPLLPQIGYAAGVVTVDWTAPMVADVAAKVAVWITTHQRLYHKQIVGYETASVLTLGLAKARAANGNYLDFTATVPFELICQLQTVNPSGWASPGSETVEVVCV